MPEGVQNWQWLEGLIRPGDYATVLEVRRKIEPLLAGNIMPHFTDHSIGHCDRVIDVLHRLVNANISAKDERRLTEDELFVLALAVLLHDVGMQMPKAHGIETPVTELTREELGQIRENHGVASGDVVRRLANDDDDILHIGAVDHGGRRRLPLVAALCEKHQSAAEYDPSEACKLGRGEVRIGLLIALLRLSDQLDCDSRRIDLNRLDHFSIPPDSVLHWLVCSYIDAVTVNSGFVEISASFPDSMTGPEIDYVSMELIKKVKSEYGVAERAFWNNGVPIRVPNAIIRTKTDYTHKKSSLPPAILERIRGQLSAASPAYVTPAPSASPSGEEVDWMWYWKVIGNPFLDREVAYGMDRFVETPTLRRYLAEVGSFLQGSEGELKLLIAPRGMGKTTFFESIRAKYEAKYDVVLVDVGEQVGNVRNVADLKQLLFYSIHRRISSSEPDESPEPLLEAARLGNKKVLCVDSMDRLPEGKEPIVRDFFRSAQSTLSKLRTICVILFACGDTWGNYLASEELSYLGLRNQWSLPAFTSDEVQQMLDKRLRACGSSYLTIFEPGCTTILQTVSGGNPRRVLEKVEAICRLAAQKGEKRVTPAFIREQYEKDFDQAIERLLASLAASHKECAKAITSIYHFYLEMERRALPTSEGWNYLVELMETGLPLNKIQGSYRTALRYVSSATATVGEFQTGAPAVLTPPAFLKQLFKELKKRGFSVRDFVAFYSTNPVVPGGKEDDLGLLLKSPPVMGPDVEYFEKARALFVTTKRSTGPPFQVISDAWDCVEYMVYAILLKAEAPGVSPIIAKRESWLVPDRFGILRFVRGAGKLRADHAFELTDYFSKWRKQRQLWMDTLPSLKWLRDERANVVRGRTEYLSRYGSRERDLALTHLDAVFKELSRIYG